MEIDRLKFLREKSFVQNCFYFSQIKAVQIRIEVQLEFYRINLRVLMVFVLSGNPWRPQKVCCTHRNLHVIIFASSATVRYATGRQVRFAPNVLDWNRNVQHTVNVKRVNSIYVFIVPVCCFFCSPNTFCNNRFCNLTPKRWKASYVFVV